jgi:uncharacterized protein (DUF433 family)
MALPDRIVVDASILTGKPAVRGTRISVALVVELLAGGWSHGQILASYPHLAEEDIRACLACASELLREEKVYPLKTALESWPARILPGRPWRRCERPVLILALAARAS